MAEEVVWALLGHFFVHEVPTTADIRGSAGVPSARTIECFEHIRLSHPVAVRGRMDVALALRSPSRVLMDERG